MTVAELVRPGLIRAQSWPGPIRPERYGHRSKAAQEDFAERLTIGETIKENLRRRYARLAPRRPNEPYDRMLARAIEFWSEYEEINLLWVPEDPVYSKACNGIAISTTLSTWEFKSAASGQSRILEFFIGGEATSTAVNRLAISRVTSSGTGTAPTSYTPETFNSRSPAAAGTYYGGLTANVDWGTNEATLATNPLLPLALNAFGGSDRWVAQPGEEIYSVNAEYISCRSISGTSTFSEYVIVEEL